MQSDQFIEIQKFDVSMDNSTSDTSNATIEILITANTVIHEISSRPTFGEVRSTINFTQFGDLDDISGDDPISKLINCNYNRLMIS